MSRIATVRPVKSSNGKASNKAKQAQQESAARTETVGNVVPVITPAPRPQTLANASAEEQASAVCDALKAPYSRIAAAALAECKGDATMAASLVGDAVRPAVALSARIIPLLRSAAPAPLFTDRNGRGARVGELFASRLGLSALYRDTSRADLKAARAALVESAK